MREDSKALEARGGQHILACGQLKRFAFLGGGGGARERGRRCGTKGRQSALAYFTCYENVCIVWYVRTCFAIREERGARRTAARNCVKCRGWAFVWATRERLERQEGCNEYIQADRPDGWYARTSRTRRVIGCRGRGMMRRFELRVRLAARLALLWSQASRNRMAVQVNVLRLTRKRGAGDDARKSAGACGERCCCRYLLEIRGGRAATIFRRQASPGDKIREYGRAYSNSMLCTAVAP